MKKLLLFIAILFSISSYGQNRFPSIDSAKNYVLRYVKNSAVESFTNLRMQNVVYGTLQLLDSLAGAGVIDTIFKSGDTLKYKIGSTTFTVGTFGGGSTPNLQAVTDNGNTITRGDDSVFMQLNNRTYPTSYIRFKNTDDGVSKLRVNGASYYSELSNTDLYLYDSALSRQFTLFSGFKRFDKTTSTTVNNVDRGGTFNEVLSIRLNGTTYQANDTGSIELGSVGGSVTSATGTGTSLVNGSSKIKRLKSGSNISVTDNTDSVTIAFTGSVGTTNADSTAARIRTGTYAQMKSITSPTNGMSFIVTDYFDGLYVYNNNKWNYTGEINYSFKMSPNKVNNQFGGFSTISNGGTVGISYNDSIGTSLFFQTNASTNAEAGMNFGSARQLQNTSDLTYYIYFEMKLSDLSDVTNRYTFCVSGFDSSSAFALIYNDAVNSGNWVLKTDNQRINTNLAVDTKIHSYLIKMMPNKRIEFYVDGVLISTTNPISVSVFFPEVITIKKSAGTTTRDVFLFTYFGAFKSKYSL